MNAYKCDRCGRYYENDGCHKYLYLNMKIVLGVCGTTTKPVDICPACQDELENWFDEGREATE